jgi:hypothetical protein
VITASESVGVLISMIEDSSVPAKSQQPMTASLKAAAASSDRGNLTAATNQLRAFQSKVSAQIAASDPELAAELIHAAEQIIEQLAP